MKQRVQQAVESVQNGLENNGSKSNISVCFLRHSVTNR